MGVTDCEGALTHCKKYGARPGRRGEGTPPYKRNTDCETSGRTGFVMTHRKKCDTSPAGGQRCPPLRTFYRQNIVGSALDTPFYRTPCCAS